MLKKTRLDISGASSASPQMMHIDYQALFGPLKKQEIQKYGLLQILGVALWVKI